MKNHSRTTNYKLLWMLFFSALPVVVFLRSHQLRNLLEPVDGFYASRDWTITALNLFLLLVTALFVGISYFGNITAGSVLRYNRAGIKSRTMTVASFLFAAFLLYDALLCIGRVNEKYAEFQLMTSDSVENYSTFTILMKTGLLPCLLEGVMAVPAAIFVIAFGVDHLKGNSNIKGKRVLALFPSVWLVMRTIFNFTHTLSFRRVSELFFVLIVMAFMLIFFMSFAQSYSKINENDFMLPAFGFPAALIALMGYFSRLLMVVTGNADKLTEIVPLDTMELALAFFILCILKSRITSETKQQA